MTIFTGSILMSGQMGHRLAKKILREGLFAVFGKHGSHYADHNIKLGLVRCRAFDKDIPRVQRDFTMF
jgi:hypothetical protein